MARKLLIMTVVGVLVVVGAAWTSSEGVRVRANVPFDFYFGNDVLPAGQYVFEMRPLTKASASASTVIVSNSDGRVMALRPSLPGTSNPSVDCLRFLRYGSTNFLTTVEGMGFQANLTKSSAERKLIAEGMPAEGLTLAAAR